MIPFRTQLLDDDYQWAWRKSRSKNQSATRGKDHTLLIEGLVGLLFVIVLPRSAEIDQVDASHGDVYGRVLPISEGLSDLTTFWCA